MFVSYELSVALLIGEICMSTFGLSSLFMPSTETVMSSLSVGT